MFCGTGCNPAGGDCGWTSGKPSGPINTNPSDTSVCTAAKPCKGDITWFTAGLEACSSVTNGDKEKIVALPYALMGALSNTNPYCGKVLTIKCTAIGKTTTATVMDKCMGCDDLAIDLSSAVFKALENPSVGRTGATWWFGTGPATNAGSASKKHSTGSKSVESSTRLQLLQYVVL